MYNRFAVVHKRDRSSSASYLTLSTKEAKPLVFNCFPLLVAEKALCISVTHRVPWFTSLAERDVSPKKMKI